MKSHFPLSRFLIVLLYALWLAACATPQGRPDALTFPTSGAGAEAASQWMRGGEVSADVASVESRYVAAEAAFWDGDVQRALTLHLGILSSDLGHPLARFSAARVQELNDDVVGWHEQVAPVLAQLRYGADLNPLTAVSLSTTAQRAALRAWSNTRTRAPFDAAPLGLPQPWMASPRMSPWRQLDMDTAFLPERDSAMAPRYLSPAVAEDVPNNYQPRQPMIAEGVNLSPKLGAPGVYYLETFASAAEGGDYLIYANLSSAARLWIDGQEIMSRDEDASAGGAYGTGKRLRRVRLGAGVHRVLLKVAYQPGYRDWFDMVFMRDGASPLQGSGLTFSHLPPGPLASRGEVTITGPMRLPHEVEPLPELSSVSERTPWMSAYLEALAAFYDYQPARFERAIGHLLARYPGFAPAHALRAQQVQTLWEMPGRLRDAQALQALRAAYNADQDSVHHALALGEWLKRQEKSDEARALLERAYKNARRGGGRIINQPAVRAWASYLEGQRWDAAAETIWTIALANEPADCVSATRLHGLRRQRQDMRSPVAYTDKIASACPQLVESWVYGQPDMREEQLELARVRAARYPWRADYAQQLVRQLSRMERGEEADQVLAAAIKQMPWEVSLRAELVQRTLAAKGADAALSALEMAVADNGMEESWLWTRAAIDQELPLVDLLQDGPSVARAVVESTGADAAQGDEAIYIIDFAAKQYLPDGSGVQITHTMVRLMTKNAIDAQAEVQIPRGAKVIHARTIKQDGSVRAPEEVSGKETLSMPGLAEGDFIEVAYLQFDAPSGLSRTQVEGTRFFFKMADISSKRSEFVLIDPPGEVLSQHDAPTPERFVYRGRPALRFVRTDSPRPRSEPAAPPADEYLPWVQLLRVGTSLTPLAVKQRTYREALRDGMRQSASGRALFDGWIKAAGKAAGDARARALFHSAAQHFPEPAPAALSTELAHALATRQGSPVVALKALYDQAKIPAHIYLARPRTEPAPLHPLLEPSDYSGLLVRAEVEPGRWVWLDPVGVDAMYGAIGDAYFGQPALCVTCDAPTIEQVPADGHRAPLQAVSVTGALDAAGTLEGEVSYTLDGTRAVYVRGLLRQRADEAARAKLADALLSDVIPGAGVKGYTIEHEAAPDQVLTFKIQFVRPQFARPGHQGGLEVEVAMFREPLASQFGTLPARTVPLAINHGRERTWSLSIKLPAGKRAQLVSKSGSWQADSAFGQFSRSVELVGDQLTILSALKTPAQRVAPAQYADFRQWAIAVEQSSYLAFVVE
jgi:thioredoxin-like negative regulator of GroEL